MRRGPELFFIQDGIRRALAAREAGRKTIVAVVYREGSRPTRHRVRIERLYSPKETVEQDRRYEDITLPIREAITVEPLGERVQSQAVPLMDVTLVPPASTPPDL